MSRRSDYFALAAISLVVAGIVTSIGLTFYQSARAASPHQVYSLWTSAEVLAAFAICALGLALVVAGFTRLPLPPWKRNRFPQVQVDITQMGASRTSPPDQVGDNWHWWRLRITNHEIDRVVSLTFVYRVKLRADSELGQKFGETIFTSPNGERPPAVPTEWLSDPVTIEAQHSLGDVFVALVRSPWNEAVALPLESTIVVVDHISKRAALLRPITGTYGPNGWIEAKANNSGHWTVYPIPGEE
jgi:hypothetical protein